MFAQVLIIEHFVISVWIQINKICIIIDHLENCLSVINVFLFMSVTLSRLANH